MILFVQTALVVFSVLACGLVSLMPSLSNYTFQFLGVSVAAFFLVNMYVRHHQIELHFDKDRTNIYSAIEVALIGFALSLVICTTGGYGSWLVSLYLIYFLLLIFVCPLLPTAVSFLSTLVLFYLTTPDFGPIHYSPLLSLVVFSPVAIAFQKLYTDLIAQRQRTHEEEIKVAYYNVYAEQQQENILAGHPVDLNQPLIDFVEDELIPQLDELQKQSRFTQNQLIVASGLTKLALQVRQAVRLDKKQHEKPVTGPNPAVKPNASGKQQS